MIPASTPWKGALCGLGSAALFGLGAPLSKLLVPHGSAILLAGILYLGAGTALSLFAAFRRRGTETRLQRRDIPLLLGVILSGGIVGPVLLLLGLQRISAVESALLLNLEGVFTILLAVLLFGEHLGRRAVAAAALVLVGAVVLSLAPKGGVVISFGVGPLAVMGACFAWGIDNNLTQRLSVRDPIAIVRAKTLSAGVCNTLIAVLFGAHLPELPLLGGALLLGAASYGTSIVLDVYALRILGAAREAAFFATAPFIGALAAVPLLGERLHRSDLGGGALMAVGVVLLFQERHGHLHTHDPIEHEHLHEHDEHHQHPHAEGEPVVGAHSHPHRHDSITHDHPHVSDLHHRHRH